MSAPAAFASHCIRCRKQIDPMWAFCVYCGADNRQPETRPNVGPHTHMYVGEAGANHCWVCGYDSTSPSRRLFAGSVILIGIPIAIGTVLILISIWYGYGPHSPAHADLDRVVSSYSGRHSYHATTVGDQISQIYYLIGAAFIFVPLKIAYWVGWSNRRSYRGQSMFDTSLDDYD